MPGTRTAPTVDGTFDYINVSISLIDYTGEVRTDSYQLDADSTDAEVEAFVAATAALSNASVWRVRVGQVYNSVPDSSNAIEEVWEDIKTNLVILAKNPLNDAQNIFIPAPINDLFIEGTEELDPTNVALGDYLTAYLAMKANYSIVSGRFTQRRSMGTRVAI